MSNFFHSLKRSLYFPVAFYFQIFAKIRLLRWKPRIIVVTGSNGKTTLLHLIYSQLQEKAKYSYQANSNFGIPFNILGLGRKTMFLSEWPGLFLKAPILAFRTPPKEKIYVVEADCDRPGEDKFISSLSAFLKPEVTLWVSVSRTHTMNFDQVVKEGKFQSVEEAIAYEFGHFVKRATKLVVVNGDSDLIESQLKFAKAQVIQVYLKDLTSYQISETGTQFKFGNRIVKLKSLLPPTAYYSIKMTLELLNYLKMEAKSFENFSPPPGRSTLFEGVKNTTLIDSSYNANLESMATVLEMYKVFPQKPKWAVIGDMLELGEEEQIEHEKLGKLISETDLDRLVLMGPRVSQYTYPKVKEIVGDKYPLVTFTTPVETLAYLQEEIKGGETILFKGARFLEGVIENLLLDRSQKKDLARREEIWEKRRKGWGL